MFIATKTSFIWTPIVRISLSLDSGFIIGGYLIKMSQNESIKCLNQHSFWHLRQWRYLLLISSSIWSHTSSYTVEINYMMKVIKVLQFLNHNIFFLRFTRGSNTSFKQFKTLIRFHFINFIFYLIFCIHIVHTFIFYI